MEKQTKQNSPKARPFQRDTVVPSPDTRSDTGAKSDATYEENVGCYNSGSLDQSVRFDKGNT